MNAGEVARGGVISLPFDWPRSLLGRVAGDRRGTEAIEFALTAPVLLLIVFGIIQFGFTLNNYVMLTDAAGAGVRQFAISRSSATPYSTTTTTVAAAAPDLTAGSITLTLQVNGTACASDTACQTALSNAAGGSATLTAGYPCNLEIMGVNFAPSCSLSAQVTDLVE